MKLISNDLRDGDKLPHRHVLTAWVTMAIMFHRIWRGMMFRGNEKFCCHLLRPGCANRLRWWHWVVVNLPADTRVLPQGLALVW